jgi:hypothetical protein
LLRTRTQPSSGSSVPQPDVLAADRAVIDDDGGLALYERSLADGWGDGLPVVAPTEARVRAMLAASPWHADDVIGVLPPMNREATVELVAINAALAGCAPEAFPVLVAALEAICTPEHNLYGLTTTTSSVIPMLIVNGPSRDRLGIDYGPGCMGGAAGRGSSTIGRALSLCLRNIGGQKVGDTSKSVFGQPARTAGLCFGEWEERSPWPSVATQWGYPEGTDVVTVHGGKGTMPIADVNCDDARDLLRLIAKSIAFPLSNKFLTPIAGNGQTVLAINPMWAERFGREFPDVDDLKAFLHEHAWQPVDLWPEKNRAILEAKNRVDAQGRVWLNERPDQIVPVVCGGLGNLHAIVLPSWGDSEIAHRAVTWA